jgi:hypothetical protein
VFAGAGLGAAAVVLLGSRLALSSALRLVGTAAGAVVAALELAGAVLGTDAQAPNKIAAAAPNVASAGRGLSASSFIKIGSSIHADG